MLPPKIEHLEHAMDQGFEDCFLAIAYPKGVRCILSSPPLFPISVLNISFSLFLSFFFLSPPPSPSFFLSLENLKPISQIIVLKGFGGDQTN